MYSIAALLHRRLQTLLAGQARLCHSRTGDIMTPLLTLLDYNLEIEWALTWFPTRASANLKEVRMRGGTITHRTSDPAFTVGNKVGHLLAQGDETDKTEDSLEPNELVRASLSVGVTPGGIFEVDLEVRIGPTRRTKYLRLP